MNPTKKTSRPKWEIFCQVVDNFGDIGVCWRLAKDLAARTSAGVRLWVDDWSVLERICPQAAALNDDGSGLVAGVELRRWDSSQKGSHKGADKNAHAAIEPGEVVIEAFACELPEAHQQAMRQQQPHPVWINLEYLSAEAWVAGCHGMASPHPRLGLVKHFFFPGFDEQTGGLLREPGLLQRRDALRRTSGNRTAWLAGRGVKVGEAGEEALCVSLFAYAQSGLAALLQAWATGRQAVHLLVPEGRMLDAVCLALGRPMLHVGEHFVLDRLTIYALPFTDQDSYDELLWACDLNFVRGEDSFVRAQWAGLPFVWQIYPQDDNAHMDKLEAFMGRYASGLEAHEAAALKAFWRAWNGGGDVVDAWPDFAATLPALSRHAAVWCNELAAQTDLASCLLAFCAHRQLGPG